VVPALTFVSKPVRFEEPAIGASELRLTDGALGIVGVVDSDAHPGTP
jgi:hypothetical protein